MGVTTNEGKGREERYEKQEGQRHENKPAHCDRARKDGRLNPGWEPLHHDTCAATGESAGAWTGIPDARPLRIVQQSVEDRILETNIVFN